MVQANRSQAQAKRIRTLLLLVALAACAVGPARTQQSAPEASSAPASYLDRSENAVQTLQTWYQPATGLYATTGWWNSANAITVLVDYARLKKSKQYDDTLANTFSAAQKKFPGFLNKFYDDEGWWALAWIDAYDLTRKPAYLSMAQSIFTDMAGGWDDTCGGGIWWSKDKNYKNAIANELFLSVAAHLVNRTAGSTRDQYLSWSDKEWKWFQASGMINSDNLVNDGLNMRPDPSGAASCTNNGKTTWTYNQGVVLGGLGELFQANHDPALTQAAEKIATAATSRLADQAGILHDPCEPECGADGVQFKGIFVRNLVSLNNASPKPSYDDFIFRNADSLWNTARGPNFQLDVRWSGPFIAANAGSQSSGLDALIGAAGIASAKQKAR